MEAAELIKEINKNMAMVLPSTISMEGLQIQLGNYLNQLIRNDFQQLIFILYRIDVSETKLKQVLQKQPPADAGDIIATLIIERQLQKIKTRQQFNQGNNNHTGEEEW